MDKASEAKIQEAATMLFNQIDALIEWNRRTGGDISRFFGNYTPPVKKHPPKKNSRYTPPRNQ